jgi:hypothetical protein
VINGSCVVVAAIPAHPATPAAASGTISRYELKRE